MKTSNKYVYYFFFIILLFLLLYFLKNDYISNCVNDYKKMQNYYNDKFAQQYGLIACNKLKKEDLNTFNLLKGKVFSKTTAFKKYLPH